MGLMARSGAQTGTEAELEPMPDWERELLVASQEPAPATPHEEPAATPRRCRVRSSLRRLRSRPKRQPTSEIDIELQSDNADPENAYNRDYRFDPQLITAHPMTQIRGLPKLMATISAAEVKTLRDATGAGMMDCKKALTEADGDFDKAVEILRVSGQAKAAKRGAERAATNGLVASIDGALLQLGAETDFVAKNQAFQALAARRGESSGREQGRQRRRRQCGDPRLRPDCRRGGRGAGHQNRGEARGQRRGVLRRPDCGLSAPSRLRSSTAGRRIGRVRGLGCVGCPWRRYADRRDASAVRQPRRCSAAIWSRTSGASPRPRRRRRASLSKLFPKIVEGRLNAYFKDVALLDQPSVTDNKVPVGKQLDEAGIKVLRFVRFEASGA